MRSTGPNKGSNGGSDERVLYVARYLDNLVGNISSRMHPSVPESASSMDKRVSACVIQCVQIAKGGNLVFVARRKLLDA